ncbi:MAG: cytochrome c [Terracidiphilus sp.]|jgi:mono/diheme cytochrome c family protein
MKPTEAINTMVRILLGVLLGVILVPAVVLAWLKFGSVPVAVDDPPLPQERLLTDVPLHERVDRELIKTPPIQVNENSLVAGAEIYRDHCAVCHGEHGKPSSFGAHMYPDAPPLWEMHHHGSETMMGVTDDPPGETYWKVVNGIRLTGMPSFKGVLTDSEMWQVSLLLANADKPLPPEAVDILHAQPSTPAGPAMVNAPAKRH